MLVLPKSLKQVKAYLKRNIEGKDVKKIFLMIFLKKSKKRRLFNVRINTQIPEHQKLNAILLILNSCFIFNR